MEHLQLDRLVQRLESAFGEELPFSTGELSAAQVDVLRQVFGDEGKERLVSAREYARVLGYKHRANRYAKICPS